jgi:predicted outer membrane repeat protein
MTGNTPKHPSITSQVVLSSLLLALSTTVAATDATVGNGTSASCTEAALTSAINTVQSDSQGGTVRFNCGAAFRTIAISTTKNLTGLINIDGGGAITLTGQDTNRIFVINPRPNPEDRTIVGLQNITLRNGFASGDFGGAILGNGGVELNLDNVTINNSRAGLTGGALAMAPNTTLVVNNSSFRENTATDGGAIATSAVTTIEGSRFVLNTASGTGNSGQGGAVQSYVQNLTIRRSLFSFNLGNRGGAVYKRNAFFLLEDSQFSDNSSAIDGGGLFAESGVQLRTFDSEFRGNIATNGRGGAVVASYFDGVNSLFDNNRAQLGGALSIRPQQPGDLAALADCTLSNNFAQTDGGAVEISSSVASGFGSYQVTTSNNIANNGSGGDFYIGNNLTTSIFRSTLLDGQAAISAGGGSVFKAGVGTVTIGASMIYSRQGQDCAGAGSFVSQGANLGVASCGLNFAGSDLAQADQLILARTQLGLGEFANYGGRYNHHMPQAGSPALNTFVCHTSDLDARKLPRNVGNRCDSGAVERQLGEQPAALFRNGFEGG